jgi:hypothetical protein
MLRQKLGETARDIDQESAARGSRTDLADDCSLPPPLSLNPIPHRGRQERQGEAKRVPPI